MTLLRTPSVDELPEVSALCLSSKAHWGYDAEFIAACVEELTVRPEELESSHLVVLDSENGLSGMCQLGIDGPSADLLKLFVAPNQMGLGHGRRLMDWAIASAREQGARRMTIEADPFAESFYLRAGAHRIGQVPSVAIPGRNLPLLELLL